MENICNKCGAKLKDDARFCQECGDKIKYPQKSYCPNCGAKIVDSENFCQDCGATLYMEAKQSTESFIEKYKIPIIVGLLVVILLISGLIVLKSQESTSISLPPTTVTVGAQYFEIPGEFAINSSYPDIQTEGGVVSYSQSFSDGYDSIFIGVIAGGYNADLDSVAASTGGVRKNLMGYDGYYNENDINDYTFSFVANNRVCMIGTTSPHLFDEIKVL